MSLKISIPIKTKCNDEFIRQYNDMTKRLRDAVFCEESEPDHMLPSDSDLHKERDFTFADFGQSSENLDWK